MQKYLRPTLCLLSPLAFYLTLSYAFLLAQPLDTLSDTMIDPALALAAQAVRALLTVLAAAVIFRLAAWLRRGPKGTPLLAAGLLIACLFGYLSMFHLPWPMSTVLWENFFSGAAVILAFLTGLFLPLHGKK